MAVPSYPQAQAPAQAQAQAQSEASLSYQAPTEVAPAGPGAINTATTSSLPTESSHHPVDVASWAASALQSLTLSTGPTFAKGTGVPLSIPLDQAPKNDVSITNGSGGGAPVQRAAIPRQPMAKWTGITTLSTREARLEGREGTRQRRRWDNDHFKNVPNAQPPLPSDWAVQPTHPVVHVPYHLARYWDDIAASKAETHNQGTNPNKKKNEQLGRISREVRESAKRNPAFTGWVKTIEEPVRWFVQNRQHHHRRQQKKQQQQKQKQEQAEKQAESLSSSIATLISPPTSPHAKNHRVGGGMAGDDDKDDYDMELVTDNSDEEMVIFRSANSTNTNANYGNGLVQGRNRGTSTSMHMGGPGNICFSASTPFRPYTERKSVLALQREEDWEELVAVGGGMMKSRTTSNASSSSSSFSMLNDVSTTSTTSTSEDSSNWHVVPGQQQQQEADNAPAAMVFVTPEGRESTYKRWIVHSIALYYGLCSASVDDDGETMTMTMGRRGRGRRRRFVFVGPRADNGGKKGGRKENEKEVGGDMEEEEEEAGIEVPPAMWEQLARG